MAAPSPCELFSLKDKVALVTGARTGLGRAIAETLAAAGADIVGAGSGPMPQTRAAVEAAGRRCATFIADLSRPGAAERLAEEALAAFGRVDILVNNAGIIRRHDLLDHPAADWAEVLQVNLDSPFLLSQAIARAMVAGGIAGRIINIASVLSFQGGIRVPAYTASKHAIAGLTQAMANELARHRITVNAIAPGYMATDNTRALRADEERSARILERIPAGRWGVPEDLATAVLFLASPASAFVTGATVPVDGGWLAR